MQQYTDKAKAALQKAAKTARDLRQSYIGSEHILVGLVREKTGVAAKVLADNGVEDVQLISMIKELIAPEGNVATMERDGYSPDRYGAYSFIHFKRGRKCRAAAIEYNRNQRSEVVYGHVDCDGRRY